MKRPIQNLWIDIVSFILFVVLVATGLLMAFSLPPGSHGWAVWGLGRHAWGDVHFWVAIAMLATIALHLVMHWRWIVCTVKGRPLDSPQARRRVRLGLVSLAVLLILAAALFISPKQSVAEGPERAGTTEHVATIDREHAGVVGADAIRGSMSLYEVEQATGVSVAFLLHELGLPPNTLSDVPLRELAQQHGFGVETARQIVAAQAMGD
jgi:hypothetical protein